MATMNISLPDALKAALDAETGMNWSAIARDAFTRELDYRGWRKMEVGTEQNLARLRGARGKPG